MQNSWRWGPDGHGAIVLANLDQDAENPASRLRDSDDDIVDGAPDLDDLSRMIVQTGINLI